MTRKHYIALAAALKEARAKVDNGTPAGHTAVGGIVIATIEIADALAADNGRFDRARFYRATGLDR